MSKQANNQNLDVFDFFWKLEIFIAFFFNVVRSTFDHSFRVFRFID